MVAHNSPYDYKGLWRGKINNEALKLNRFSQTLSTLAVVFCLLSASLIALDSWNKLEEFLAPLPEDSPTIGFIIAGILFLWSFVEMKEAAASVCVQYGLPKRLQYHFYRLYPDTFDKSLAKAQAKYAKLPASKQEVKFDYVAFKAKKAREAELAAVRPVEAVAPALTVEQELMEERINAHVEASKYEELFVPESEEENSVDSLEELPEETHEVDKNEPLVEAEIEGDTPSVEAEAEVHEITEVSLEENAMEAVIVENDNEENTSENVKAEIAEDSPEELSEPAAEDEETLEEIEVLEEATDPVDQENTLTAMDDFIANLTSYEEVDEIASENAENEALEEEKARALIEKLAKK